MLPFANQPIRTERLLKLCREARAWSWRWFLTVFDACFGRPLRDEEVATGFTVTSAETFDELEVAPIDAEVDPNESDRA